MIKLPIFLLMKSSFFTAGKNVCKILNMLDIACASFLNVGFAEKNVYVKLHCESSLLCNLFNHR